MTMIAQTNFDLERFVFYNNQNPLVKLYQSNDNNNYTQVRYLKNELDNSMEDPEYYAQYRSITLDNEAHIIGYGIPKTMGFDMFTYHYNDVPLQNFTVEEFIEGTQIQLFYNPKIEKIQNKKLEKLIKSNKEKNQGWMIATRSKIHATSLFYKNHLNVSKDNDENDKRDKNFMDFANMFIECGIESQLDLSQLDKSICYNFIMQHEQNIVINKISKQRLYLLQGYKFIQNRPKYISGLDLYNQIFENTDMIVYTPCQFDIEDCFDFEDIQKNLQFKSYIPKSRPHNSMGSEHVCPGIIIKAPDGRHCKISNPYFEYLRELRGNQPKLEYTYYELRQKSRVTEFLSQFPEFKKDFLMYKEKIEAFTTNLYDVYVNTKMLRKDVISNVDYHLRNHISNLHKIYLEDLRPYNNTLQHRGVIKYVNNLAPSLLMYSMNYKKRINTKNDDNNDNDNNENNENNENNLMLDG